ncbi:unnamed protein product [Linum tenue]|uniref:Uncharacterized protein n=1 Tax=Linum tenue TaxID=586396 RepID=A0AAV0IGX7_9ROSI|nr:unnamed protein product [Linum tenue]
MGLKVEITSTESIKPSSPTPHHLRTHNLTILDQTAPSCYVPLCLFFYPHTSSSSSSSSSSFLESLKGSLANTLNVYHPLAGRYRDAFAVDCNDAGAEFVNARVVAGSMSDVVRQAPDDDVLVPLLPCRPRGRHVDSEGELVLLAVQVSFFDGGGVSIGVCVWHGLADACTLACFLATWSGFATQYSGGRTISEGNDAVVEDCTAVFPPADLSLHGECMERFRAAVATPGTRTKRFVFDGGKIAALRRGIEESSWRRRLVAEPEFEISEKIPLRHVKLQQPTRVTAVAAVIWAAAIKIARDNKKKKSRRDDVHIAAMATNLRPRMNPGFAEHVMGNLVQIPVFAEWPLNDEAAVENAAEHGRGGYYGALAGKLRESVRNVTDESVRKAAVAGSGGSPSSFLGGLMRRFVEAHDGGNLLVISSWCRFPFYEVDFGVGKPSWICTFTMSHNLAVLMDAKDGEGIEAWVTLSADEMSEFENDAGMLQYATSSSNGVGVHDCDVN